MFLNQFRNKPHKYTLSEKNIRIAWSHALVKIKERGKVMNIKAIAKAIVRTGSCALVEGLDHSNCPFKEKCTTVREQSLEVAQQWLKDNDEKKDINSIEQEKLSAFDTQVGGDHYTKLAIQPMEYSMKNNLNCLQHTIIKYITRYKDKNGEVDLLKAIHCIEMLIQIEYTDAKKDIKEC